MPRWSPRQLCRSGSDEAARFGARTRSDEHERVVSDMPAVWQEIGEDNSICEYDKEAIGALEATKPWKEDPYYLSTLYCYSSL